MTVKIMSDFHHSDLYESLGMVFVDRFGWDLYRPIGMEWYDSGIWAFEKAWHGDAIAKQYLGQYETDRDCGDHWERDDETHPGRVHKMLTMDQARDAGLDIVIATLTENEPGLAFFARQIGAVYGIQTGNQGTDNRYDLLDFAIFSTTRATLPSKPYVFHHQEFSLEDFRFEYPPPERDKVSTWVQCISQAQEDFARFVTLAEMAPELKFRYHGHCQPDSPYWESNVRTTPEVAAQMRAARVGLHLKRWSDGYGHVIHNLFAVGKPVVGTASYYADKLAGPLFVEGVTSFDVQTKNDAEVVAIIRRLATDDEFHQRISENAATRFREVVDFGADAEAIRTMLDGVLSDRRVPA